MFLLAACAAADDFTSIIPFHKSNAALTTFIAPAKLAEYLVKKLPIPPKNLLPEDCNTFPNSSILVLLRFKASICLSIS